MNTTANNDQVLVNAIKAFLHLGQTDSTLKECVASFRERRVNEATHPLMSKIFAAEQST